MPTATNDSHSPPPSLPPMSAAPRHHRHRISRAPPPTPIATGKGTRSAAVNDLVLAEYLENSLKVPDLTLPEPSSLSRSADRRIPPEVDLSSLLSADATAIRCLRAAAAEVGAFRIVGGGDEELRSAIGVGREVFGVSEAKKGVLEGIFRRRDGVGEEFYWDRERGSEIETVLEEASPGSYRILRDKMEAVVSRLQMVAESITKILSQHIPHQRRSQQMHSVLCLRKYESSHRWREDTTKDHHSHTLSLHVSCHDHNFCIHSPDASYYVTLPAGSILVTIGEQLEERCNGEVQSSTGEILIDPSDDMLTPFSLELVYSSSPIQSCKSNRSAAKTLSILDQLLIVIALVILYNLWK